MLETLLSSVEDVGINFIHGALANINILVVKTYILVVNSQHKNEEKLTAPSLLSGQCVEAVVMEWGIVPRNRTLRSR